MSAPVDSAPNHSNRERVIEPPSGWSGIDISEIWEFRELLAFLVWRDIKVRYRQTLLGFSWALLVPLVQIVVFTFLFKRVANIDTDGIPGPAFYYAALLPWNYFSSATSLSSNSLVGNAQFLTRIYVPRLIIPTVPCIAGLVDFAIALIVLLVIAAWYSVPPTAAVLALPFLLSIAVFTTMGVGYLLSSLNVRYRDIRHAVPFLLQIWMYLTVVLPFSAIPESSGRWRYLLGLNPMTGVVEGFRWCLFHHQMHPNSQWTELFGIAVPSFFPLLAVGLPVTLAILILGLWCFRSMEQVFADTV